MSPHASAIIDDPDERWGVGANARPKVHPKRKHKMLNRVQLVGYKLFFAHLGKFIVVALYFILLETLKGQHTSLFGQPITLPDVKGTWDQLLSRAPNQGGLVRLMKQGSWDSMRHVVFRGLIEGVLGLVLFKQIGFNIEKYRAKLGKEPGRIDRLILRSKIFASPYQDCPVTPVQYMFLPVMLVLITVVLGVPVYLVVNHFAHAWSLHWLSSPGLTHNFAEKFYTGSEVYEGLIIGVVVGYAAGRSYRAYLYANTMNYGRSWVAHDRGPSWWMPWPTRQLVGELREEGVQHQQDVMAERHNAMKVLAPLGITLALALAVFGYFVISTNGFA